MSKKNQGKSRHLYLGNNTPEGFFSYYKYILGQREAEKIICIKGGPGTGKSTFMRKIGEELIAQGQDVDFMHCSADGNSLDGIVIRDKKIALVDGTSPHIVDPINPGAVDSIIHLGDYWDQEGIRLNKQAIIDQGESISGIYQMAYNYLGAAGKVYETISKIMNEAVKTEEAYKVFAGIMGKELAHKEITANQGKVSKYFATAITSDGFVSYMDSLIQGCKKIYVVETELGVDVSKMLELFAESSVFRGFDVEEYYCPLRPAQKLEHIVVPALSLAIITSNPFHPLESKKYYKSKDRIFTYRAHWDEISEYRKEVLEDSSKLFHLLLEQGIDCLRKAKKSHDELENYYIPNMDFGKIEMVRQELIKSIL